MDSLFDPNPPAGSGSADTGANQPLAAAMRPSSLEHFCGQQHLLAEGMPLRVAIESGQPHSAILYGPPGTGKTTLARILATSATLAFEELSAVNAGRADVAAVIKRAKERSKIGSGGTLLFLDEIHRFNKAQQDALLPAVEDGTLLLIGATTENPFFEVNGALLSRMRIYELNALSVEDVYAVLKQAVAAHYAELEVDEEALQVLAAQVDGDARMALSNLELTVTQHQAFTQQALAATVQLHNVAYDRQSDNHYDYISAWIKSTRGSDVDASLYYLAVMIEGGEDPRFIARRMVIFASEDIGNAQPQALSVANAAAQAVDRVGKPECYYALAQAAVFLSLAPKSDASGQALKRARQMVRQQGAKPPPKYLRSSGYPGAEELDRGQGYESPHRQPGGISTQQLRPEGLEEISFYKPTAAEPLMQRFYEELKQRKGLK